MVAKILHTGQCFWFISLDRICNNFVCICGQIITFWNFSFFQGGTIAIQSVLDRPDFFTGAIFSAPSVKADPAVATACLVRDNSQNYKKSGLPFLSFNFLWVPKPSIIMAAKLVNVLNNWLLLFVEGDVFNITINI